MSEPLTGLAVKEKIAELDSVIKAVHPKLPLLLREVHSILAKDASVVTLLTEEEIAVLVSGLERQTKVEITTTTLKKKAPKNVSVLDL